MIKQCDVCGSNEEVVSMMSGLGSVTFGYCSTCAKTNAEPYGMVVMHCAMSGIKWEEEVFPWFKTVVQDTLNATGKSVEELKQDVSKMIEEEDAYALMVEEITGEGFEDIVEELNKG